MVFCKINGVVASPAQVLRNGDLVNVVTYPGEHTAKSYARHASWLTLANTRSTRHKLLKFLRDHAALKEAADAESGDAATEGDAPPPGESSWGFVDPSTVQPDASASSAAAAEQEGLHSCMLNSVLILRVECGDRTGLLADVSTVIAKRGLSIRSYSGKPLDESSGTCQQVFELGGDSQRVAAVCEDLSSLKTVLRWQTYCA